MHLHLHPRADATRLPLPAAPPPRRDTRHVVRGPQSPCSVQSAVWGAVRRPSGGGEPARKAKQHTEAPHHTVPTAHKHHLIQRREASAVCCTRGSRRRAAPRGPALYTPPIHPHMCVQHIYTAVAVGPCSVLRRVCHWRGRRVARGRAGCGSVLARVCGAAATAPNGASATLCLCRPVRAECTAHFSLRPVCEVK